MKESEETPKLEAKSHSLPFLKKAVADKHGKKMSKHHESKSSMRGKAGK